MSTRVHYTTHAFVTGGRSDHTRSAGGIVDLGLDVAVAA